MLLLSTRDSERTSHRKVHTSHVFIVRVATTINQVNLRKKERCQQIWIRTDDASVVVWSQANVVWTLDTTENRIPKSWDRIENAVMQINRKMSKLMFYGFSLIFLLATAFGIRRAHNLFSHWFSLIYDKSLSVSVCIHLDHKFSPNEFPTSALSLFSCFAGMNLNTQMPTTMRSSGVVCMMFTLSCFLVAHLPIRCTLWSLNCCSSWCTPPKHLEHATKINKQIRINHNKDMKS